MKFYFFSLFLVLFNLDSIVYAESESSIISLSEVSEIVDRKYGFSDLIDLKRESVVSDFRDQAALENPIISYGIGFLKYNGGEGNAGYDEINVNQKIPINGNRSRIRKQGDLLGKLAEIEGNKAKLSVTKDALITAINYYAAEEKRKHIDQRAKYLKLISSYLKSKAFYAPQTKLEIQLIENKLQEVYIETNQVLFDLEHYRNKLKGYIGTFEKKSISLGFIGDPKIESLIRELLRDELSETEIFKYNKEYLDLAQKSQESRWIPDLQVYYSRNSEKYSGGNSNQVIGLGIAVPIFNSGKSKLKSIDAQMRANKIEYSISKNNLESVRNELLANINKAIYYRATFSQRKIQEKENLLVKFEQDFKKGLVKASDFLELEDQVHKIHKGFLDSQIEIYSSLLALIELSGNQQYLQEIF